MAYEPNTASTTATTAPAASPSAVQVPGDDDGLSSSGTTTIGAPAAPAPAAPVAPWRPPQRQFRPTFWQPSQPAGIGGVGQRPQAPAQAPFYPQQAIARQALGGARAGDIQAYMQALRAVGAGGNNAQLTSRPGARAAPSPLFAGQPAYNGLPGRASYVGGFNGGMGDVSYASQGPTLSGASTVAALHPLMPAPDLPGTSTSPSTTGASTVPGLLPSSTTSPTTTGASTIAGLPTMSDERAKRAVKSARSPLRAFLDEIGAHEYEYRDERHGKGRFVSPMAQELERTKLGKSAVVETPEGKMVDYGRLRGVELAAVSDLHQRVKALEGGKRA